MPSDIAGRAFVISEKPLKSTPGRPVGSDQVYQDVRQPLRLAGRSTAHLPDALRWSKGYSRIWAVS